MAIKRKYTIQPHSPRFWTGRCPNGEQIISGPMLPNILAYLFDEEGQFLRRHIIPMLNSSAWDAERSRYIPRPGFYGELEAEMSKVFGDLGADELPIAIELFFDDEQSVGILDLPSEYSLFLEDPTQADDEEAHDFEESIAEWKNKDKFVVVWGPELWMSKQGKVISS